MKKITKKTTKKPRLIVALDGVDEEVLRLLVDGLGSRILAYKVGWQSFCTEGFEHISFLVGRAKKVFLDAKLFDIDTTVRAAVEGAKALGVEFMTVHGHRSVVQAAAEAACNSNLKILAVTVLTSLGEEEIKEMDFGGTVEELVCRRAQNAQEAGAAGVICSPQEVRAVRAVTDPKFLIVTPGVRPAGTKKGDQRRTGTPTEALKAGADYLVVGRPIVGAKNPLRAAEAILEEMGGV